MKLTPEGKAEVYFTIILRAHFSYESAFFAKT